VAKSRETGPSSPEHLGPIAVEAMVSSLRLQVLGPNSILMPGPVPHAYNRSYLVGEDWEDLAGALICQPGKNITRPHLNQ
jgi:hypothetical protein